MVFSVLSMLTKGTSLLVVPHRYSTFWWRRIPPYPSNSAWYYTAKFGWVKSFREEYSAAI
jgi:hypothetical protein